jgi:spore germination cell wall hydrolase CwlJ-like protein
MNLHIILLVAMRSLAAAFFVSSRTPPAAKGVSTMRQIWTAVCLAIFLLVGQSCVLNQAQKTETAKGNAEVLEKKAAPDGDKAKGKAEVLEKKAAPGGNKAPPTSAQIITKAQVQAVDLNGNEPMDDAITCLARSIYWEARGTGDASLEAIASVVMNRVGHTGFPNTICGVVKQGHEHGACQFSWWCDGRLDDAKEDEAYSHAKEIARKALNRQLKDRTNGAMYFHNRKTAPDWSKEYIKTVEVGELIFYKPAGGEAK